MVPVSSAQVGKYQLLERLGAGGMGEVYRARLVGMGGFSRELAVKLIREEFSVRPQFLEMFFREGRALAALNHRGVVQVFELDVADRRAYLAMELLRGPNLDQLAFKHARPLPWQAVAYIGAEMARALAAAHGLRSAELPNGLLHGDLSPSNVVACSDGAVKLLDFGLAKPSGHEPSGLHGKLPYLPPESLGKERLDHRVDLYSMAVVLYELLTGQRLFRGENDMQTLDRVLTQEAPPPSRWVSEVPAALEMALLKALSKDRDKRQASCTELATELETVLGNGFRASDLAALVAQHWQPDETDDGVLGAATRYDRPISTGTRHAVLGLVRRRKLIAAGAVVAAVALTVVGVGIMTAGPKEQLVASATAHPRPTEPTISAAPVAVVEPAIEPIPLPAAAPVPPKARAPKPAEKPAPKRALPPGYLADPFATKP
jgi:hypothetical protein